MGDPAPVSFIDDTFTCTCFIDGDVASSFTCTPALDCEDGMCTGETVDTRYTTLSPGSHILSVTCSEYGQTSTPQTGTVLIANGDGHVVLIGTNYALSPGPSGDLESLPAGPGFVNSVTTLTAAANYAPPRQINVLGVVIPNADPTLTVDPTEKENALSSLDPHYGTTPALRPWYTEIGDINPTTLQSALVGKDVVLIFDQHNPAIGPTVTNAWLTELQQWIIGGGVVIVLDGGTPIFTYQSTAHETFTMITPGGVHTGCLLNVTLYAAENDLSGGHCVSDEIDGSPGNNVPYRIPENAVFWTRPVPGVPNEPAICAGEGGEANVYHKIIRRGCGDATGKVVDSIYGHDTALASGSCYLPYLTMGHAVPLITDGKRLDVMPGVYTEATLEVAEGATIDGDRDYDATLTHNLERFRGDGCFKVEVDTQATVDESATWNGILTDVPATDIGIEAGTNAFITSDTVVGGAVGIDLADGTSGQTVTNVYVTAATTAGLHYLENSGAIPEVRDSTFVINTVGVLLEGDDAADFGTPGVNGATGSTGNNLFSCNNDADVEVNFPDPNNARYPGLREGTTLVDNDPTRSRLEYLQRQHRHLRQRASPCWTTGPRTATAACARRVRVHRSQRHR